MKLPTLIYNKEKEGESLNRLRQGSQDAFEEIFKLYWKELYRHAFSKLHDKETAQEIVQDILASLWVKREGLLITSLEYYLHTSVKNKVLNHIRSQIVHQKYWNFYKKYLPITGEVTEETVNYDDLKAALEKGTSFLSGKAKTIFELNRIEGYSVSEIAKRLKLSEKTVEYHITRSIKELRVRLKEYIAPLIAFYLFFPRQ